MKKTIAVLLALVFSLAAFAGCTQPAAQPAEEAPAAEEASSPQEGIAVVQDPAMEADER